MRMKVLFAALAIAAFAPSTASAADMPVAQRPSLLAGYAQTSCGLYYGLNAIGAAGKVEGGPPGASVLQGAIGGTIGYGCPFGSAPGNFWFAEGNFDVENLNGAGPGLSMSGPVHLEQRVGFGGPISSMLNLFPGFGPNLAVPSLPVFASGVTAGPSYPFLFVAMHEKDVGAQVMLDRNREWLISPGVGIGLQTRLSNGVVAETAAQWVMNSNGMSVGPQRLKFGNAMEVSFTLKY